MLSRIIRRWQPITSVFRQLHQSQNCRFHSDADALPMTIKKSENDLLLNNIKSAKNSFQLFDLISRNVKSFSADDTLAVFNALFVLQKNESSSIQLSSLVQNSDFEQLCRSLKRNARLLSLNDVIVALKVLVFLGVKSNSDVVMSLLNQIRFQINDISLEQIVFLEFLLQRMESNQLVDVLNLALPTVLQIQCGTKIDHENRTQLTSLLNFISRFRVNDQCTMNIVNALVLHGKDLNVQEARHIISSLSKSKFSSLIRMSDKLLLNAIEAIKRDFDFDEFDTHSVTLTMTVDKFNKGFPEFYNEGLYNKFAEFVVHNDLGFVKATFIQRQLNKMNFINMKLLKYMAKEVVKNPQHLLKGTPINIFSFVGALSKANYKPENWNEIYPLILESELMSSWPIRLPWITFANELLSLDVECVSLWNKVFNIEFLDEYLDRKNRHLDLKSLLVLYRNLQALTTYDVHTVDRKYLYEAMELAPTKTFHPLKSGIEFAFGGSSYIYTKVKTHYGQVIDHLVVFDKETKEPVRIPDDQNNFDVFYEDIKVDDDTRKCVAVMSFSSSCYCLNIPILMGVHALKIRTYEKMGLPVAVINHNTWSSLPSNEKIPYIEREVKFKL